MRVATKEVQLILNTVNSSGLWPFKYPVGNKILTEKVKDLELQGYIEFNAITNSWTKAQKQ